MAQHESILGAMIANESGNDTKVTHSSPNKVHLCGPNTLALYFVQFAGFFARTIACS